MPRQFDVAVQHLGRVSEPVAQPEDLDRLSRRLPQAVLQFVEKLAGPFVDKGVIAADGVDRKVDIVSDILGGCFNHLADRRAGADLEQVHNLDAAARLDGVVEIADKSPGLCVIDGADTDNHRRPDQFCEQGNPSIECHDVPSSISGWTERGRDIASVPTRST